MSRRRDIAYDTNVAKLQRGIKVLAIGSRIGGEFPLFKIEHLLLSISVIAELGLPGVSQNIPFSSFIHSYDK